MNTISTIPISPPALGIPCSFLGKLRTVQSGRIFFWHGASPSRQRWSRLRKRQRCTTRQPRNTLPANGGQVDRRFWMVP
jgi:hypothetical protein